MSRDRTRSPLRCPVPLALAAGRVAAAVSRRLGRGAGSVLAGRVARRLRPDVLARLAAGRTTVVVTGTNGKTTTSHLVVAALGHPGPVAHNAAGSNMTDGAITALLAAPASPFSVLEVDELHLGSVLAASGARVLVLLNLSRDQLDRSSEVRSVAASIRRAVEGLADLVVVANADDPMVVWAAAAHGGPVVWVAAGGGWEDDTLACPACGGEIVRRSDTCGWSCRACPLRRPAVDWAWTPEAGGGALVGPSGTEPVRLTLRLPGRVNLGNATMALAAVASLGVPVDVATPRLNALREVAGRYGVFDHRGRRFRLMLVKNPAGWREAAEMLVPGRPVLVAINARVADGRDVSWLWDVDVRALRGRPVVATGERAADLGVRLSYAEIPHHHDPDPSSAVDLLPAGEVDVVANYTAFSQLRARLNRCGVAVDAGPGDAGTTCRSR